MYIASCMPLYMYWKYMAHFQIFPMRHFQISLCGTFRFPYMKHFQKFRAKKVRAHAKTKKYFTTAFFPA